MQFRAKVGDRTFVLDVDVDSETIRVDGRPVRASLVSIGAYGGSLLVDDRSFRVSIEELEEGRVRISIEGEVVDVELLDEHDALLERVAGNSASRGGAQNVRAPMPGMVRAVHVVEGDSVRAGQGLLVLEAMKMENEIRAGSDGVVRRIFVEPGNAVEKNESLLEVVSEE